MISAIRYLTEHVDIAMNDWHDPFLVLYNGEKVLNEEEVPNELLVP
jgi:hypothetical protein